MALRIICSLAVFACLAAFQAGPARADNSANNCVALVGYQGKSHVIKNTCNRDVGILYCHTRSSIKGTDDSMCGNRGQYYQQRTSLKPGETHANVYSEPGDSRVMWAACFDNQFYIKQHDKTGSAFYCDYPQKR